MSRHLTAIKLQMSRATLRHPGKEPFLQHVYLRFCFSGLLSRRNSLGGFCASSFGPSSAASIFTLSLRHFPSLTEFVRVIPDQVLDWPVPVRFARDNIRRRTVRVERPSGQVGKFPRKICPSSIDGILRTGNRSP